MSDLLDASVDLNPVGMTQVRLTTSDNVTLGGTWFLPARPRRSPSVAIVVLCGAGIPARFYHRMASFLAERDAAVLTFDYRGIGASLHDGDVRKVRSGMEIWAETDIDAALADARTRFPGLPLTAITHSVGGLLVGGAQLATQLSRLVLLGPHTGYWRDYGRRWRPLLYFTWHLFQPAVTRMVGYFPGRALRLGENLPPRIALDWAERRQPAIVRPGENEERFGRLLPRFRDVRAETLAISITDDAFAPPEAAHRLFAVYSGLRVTHRVTSPAALGRKRVGHFGFLRRPACELFWRQAAAWLIPGFPNENDAEFRPCPVCEARRQRDPDSASSRG
ncbi:MAG TPA: alpha/beta fold hydrolase [Casimicrobiaceae bacterium]|nr:alpha/beta fold hydrolase [Casimicrobiaceae bacterium]